MFKSLAGALLTSALLTMSSVMASPATDPIDGFKKVGEAKLEVWFWDIYVSELYTPNGQFTPGDFPMALKIQYLRDIKAKDLVEKTGEEWRKLGFTSEQTGEWLTLVESLWPDIKEGDELTLVVHDQGDSTFYFNQQALGSVQDTAFGPSFLSIWLDENCSFPKLRKKLIGETR